jgi:hypothetical protein
MATTYEAIATVTVGSGGATDIEFTSIPGTYTDLLIKSSLRSDTATDYNYAFMRINGVTTSSYSYKGLYADSNTTGSYGNASTLFFEGNIAVGANSTASTFSNGEVYFPNYTSSTNKSFSADAVSEKNASTGVGLYLSAGLFTTSSAITSISISADTIGSQKFVEYSTATLYGIKNS